MLSMQRKVYHPALVLWLVYKGWKEALLYGGDMAIIDVVKFVAEHGSNFHHFIRDKGKANILMWYIIFLCMYWFL
jgi:hypothetical protein